MGVLIGRSQNRRGGLEADGSRVLENGEKLFESFGRGRSGDGCSAPLDGKKDTDRVQSKEIARED